MYTYVAEKQHAAEKKEIALLLFFFYCKDFFRMDDVPLYSCSRLTEIKRQAGI